MAAVRINLAAVAAALLVACGGGEPSVDSAGEGGEAAEETPSLRDRIDAATAAAEAGPSTEATEGSIAFVAAGQSYTLDFLPADENVYIPIASTVVAQSEPGSTERFQIIFSSIDLRDQEYPGVLPPEGAGQDLTSAMMMVGFSFIDPDGEEWAGPARLQVESFDDAGMLVATFTETILPHTDDELPDITLSEGRVRARLR